MWLAVFDKLVLGVVVSVLLAVFQSRADDLASRRTLVRHAVLRVAAIHSDIVSESRADLVQATGEYLSLLGHLEATGRTNEGQGSKLAELRARVALAVDSVDTVYSGFGVKARGLLRAMDEATNDVVLAPGGDWVKRVQADRAKIRENYATTLASLREAGKAAVEEDVRAAIEESAKESGSAGRWLLDRARMMFRR
jgi:hypothetical protein